MDIKVIAGIVRDIGDYVENQISHINRDEPLFKGDKERFKDAKAAIIVMRHLTLKNILSGTEGIPSDDVNLNKKAWSVYNSIESLRISVQRSRTFQDKGSVHDALEFLNDAEKEIEVLKVNCKSFNDEVKFRLKNEVSLDI